MPVGREKLACDDCVLFISSGEGEMPPSYPPGDWYVGDDEGFRKSPCGICGDKSAGNRHTVYTIVPRKPKKAIVSDDEEESDEDLDLGALGRVSNTTLGLVTVGVIVGFLWWRKR